MSRFYIVCFDVADKRRLRAVSKTLEDFGRRVQYSVFECHLDSAEHKALQQKLLKLIDPEADHVRFYSLCPKDQKGILLDGKGEISPDNSFHLF
ncbi:MAG: CRISPR-associated endonuclease Cas2 [Methylococcales bacterium]|nr:CRISPR-associated endonuclease Cas2 [Methylococcales bacterium]